MDRIGEKALNLGPAECSELLDSLLGYMSMQPDDEPVSKLRLYLEAEVDRLQELADQRQKKGLKKYTVLLLYPDYMASVYGQETWMGCAEGSTPQEAVDAARQELHEQSEDSHDPDDFFCLCVIEGEHRDKGVK